MQDILGVPISAPPDSSENQGPNRDAWDIKTSLWTSSRCPIEILWIRGSDMRPLLTPRSPSFEEDGGTAHSSSCTRCRTVFGRCILTGELICGRFDSFEFSVSVSLLRVLFGPKWCPMAQGISATVSSVSTMSSSFTSA